MTCEGGGFFDVWQSISEANFVKYWHLTQEARLPVGVSAESTSSSTSKVCSYPTWNSTHVQDSKSILQSATERGQVASDPHFNKLVWTWSRHAGPKKKITTERLIQKKTTDKISATNEGREQSFHAVSVSIDPCGCTARCTACRTAMAVFAAPSSQRISWRKSASQWTRWPRWLPMYRMWLQPGHFGGEIHHYRNGTPILRQYPAIFIKLLRQMKCCSPLPRACKF